MGQLTRSSFNTASKQVGYSTEGCPIVQKPNGPEVHVSRVKKAVFLLHSEDVSFFPSQRSTVIEGPDALALHTESVSSFPQASAPVVVSGACIRPLYDCFIAENFALSLEKLRCYTLGVGFYTHLTFERNPRLRRKDDLPEIVRLFTSVALTVSFVPKQNTVGVFAQGLKPATHSSPPVSRFDFRAGRIQAYC